MILDINKQAEVITTERGPDVWEVFNNVIALIKQAYAKIIAV